MVREAPAFRQRIPAQSSSGFVLCLNTEEEGMVKRKRLTRWERDGKTVDSGLRGEGGNAIPLSLCFFCKCVLVFLFYIWNNNIYIISYL